MLATARYKYALPHNDTTTNTGDDTTEGTQRKTHTTMMMTLYIGVLLALTAAYTVNNDLLTTSVGGIAKR